MPRAPDMHTRIVAAARDLFYRKGYNATSFSDIAASAAIPRGNFYYYFKSKDQLLESVISSRIDALLTMLADIERDHATPRERIHAYLGLPRQFEDEVSRYGCPFGSLVTELTKYAPSMRGKARRLLSLLQDWLSSQLSELTDAVTAHRIADQIISRQQGAAVMASAYGDSQWTRNEAEALRTWLNEQL